jgi:hypothetical protein
MDELTMWYRAQLDADERGLRAGLAEYLGTRMEYDFRFRLAEVDTNRRILDLHHETELESEPDHEPMGAGCAECGHFDWPCETISLLTLLYADREGYRDEWRP